MSAVQIGDFRVACIRDSVYWWDGGAYFGVVPKTLWNTRLPADELNRVPLAFNCYLIETGEHTILVETGGGDKMDPRARERMKLPPEPSFLPDVIARHGFDPDRIDIVVNSHLHWDHCGGNTHFAGGAVRPSFPRARYFASRGEWEHAHLRHPRDSVSYIDANYDPLVESGQMCLVEGEYEVAPGVRMVPAPGHNRDMTIVVAASGGQAFAFLSDLVPSAFHLQPTWVMGFDLYPLEVIDNRNRWLGRAADEGWVCGFAHDAAVDFSRIERDAKKGFRAPA